VVTPEFVKARALTAGRGAPLFFAAATDLPPPSGAGPRPGPSRGSGSALLHPITYILRKTKGLAESKV